MCTTIQLRVYFVLSIHCLFLKRHELWAAMRFSVRISLMDGCIASFTLQEFWLNAVWALNFLICFCLIDCLNVTMLNKICITMERNGLERRSGTFCHRG